MAIIKEISNIIHHAFLPFLSSVDPGLSVVSRDVDMNVTSQDALMEISRSIIILAGVDIERSCLCSST